MKSITVKATLDYLDTVLDFINEELESTNCPLKTKMQIDIAMEEIYVNIARYAYTPEVGETNIGCEVNEEGNRVTIQFTDQGVPYNPLEKEDPDVSLSAEERGLGGLGIFMVKKSMDDISYEYKGGNNILTIAKEVL